MEEIFTYRFDSVDSYDEYRMDGQEAFSRNYGGSVDYPTKKTREDINVEVLSDDLLEDILFRLPCKPLYRAKCLSKRWMTLISDAEARGRVPRTFPGFFYHGCGGEKQSWRFAPLSDEPQCGGLSLDFLPWDEGSSFKIDHTCNGLLLCSNTNLTNCRKTMCITLYVCNPLTKQLFALPQRQQRIWYSQPRFALAFDPGFPTLFMVIRFLSPQIVRGCIKIDMFSSKTNKWVECQVQGEVPSVTLASEPWSVYLNGVLHIMSSRNLLGLDIEKKRLVSVKLPKAIQPKRRSPNIRLLRGYNGCLNFIRIHGFEVLIWVLEDYSTGKWVLKHTVTTSVSVKNHPYSYQFRWSFYPMACHPDAEVLFLVGTCKVGRQRGKSEIFSYHLQNKRLEKLCSSTEYKVCMYQSARFNRLFPFFPSTIKILVSQVQGLPSRSKFPVLTTPRTFALHQ
ncbi:F-box protein At5g49610-like [Aristolochia californica]|uniref:F-box protein At5g49610-like n=1 Tax=Aristolochia californica TaxID=171875 RepID=UPI0035DE05A4